MPSAHVCFFSEYSTPNWVFICVSDIVDFNILSECMSGYYVLVIFAIDFDFSGHSKKKSAKVY